MSDKIKNILKEFAKGCSNGNPGECNHCLDAAAKALDLNSIDVIENMSIEFEDIEPEKDKIIILENGNCIVGYEFAQTITWKYMQSEAHLAVFSDWDGGFVVSVLDCTDKEPIDFDLDKMLKDSLETIENSEVSKDEILKTLRDYLNLLNRHCKLIQQKIGGAELKKLVKS